MMHFFVGLSDGVGVGVGVSHVDGGGGALIVECALLGGGFVWCVDEDGAGLLDVCELLRAGGDSAAVVVGVQQTVPSGGGMYVGGVYRGGDSAAAGSRRPGDASRPLAARHAPRSATGRVRPRRCRRTTPEFADLDKPCDPLLFFADAARRNFDLNNEALPAALI